MQERNIVLVTDCHRSPDRACVQAFKAVNITLTWVGEGKDEIGYGVNIYDPRGEKKARVKIDEKYYRPTEVQQLLGNPSKAKAVLGWEATTPVDELCKEMVESDLKLVRAGDFES